MSLSPINYQALIQQFPAILQGQLQQRHIHSDTPRELFDFVDFKNHRPEHDELPLQDKKAVFSVVSDFIARYAFRHNFLEHVPAHLLVEMIKKSKLGNIQYRRNGVSKGDPPTECQLKRYGLPEERPIWPVESQDHIEALPTYIKQLIDRKDYDAITELLENPKIIMDDYLGDKIITQIQAYAPSDIQMQWSKLLRVSKGDALMSHKQDMLSEKATKRPLVDYMQRLGISDHDLKRLSRGKILLVGGGNSPVRSGLESKRCYARVVNIDPLFPKLRPANEHVKLGLNFFHPQVGTFLRQEKFNEIWALHSLPTYANSPEEIIQFYQQTLSALKKGGTLRVYPYDVFGDTFDHSMSLSRKAVKEASLRMLEALEQRPDLFKLERFTINQKLFFKRKHQVAGLKIQIQASPEQVEQFFSEAMKTMSKSN